MNMSDYVVRSADNFSDSNYPLKHLVPKDLLGFPRNYKLPPTSNSPRWYLSTAVTI